MATDALMLAGGQLAKLAPETREALDRVLPPFWSHGNPIDILGDATQDRYRSTIEICARDQNVQGLLVLLSPQAMTDPTETARQLIPFAQLEGKPVLACWLGGVEVREGRRILSAASIPTYASPEGAVGAFLKMVQYRRNTCCRAPRTIRGASPMPHRASQLAALSKWRKERDECTMRAYSHSTRADPH
jgi:acetyltransferase